MANVYYLGFAQAVPGVRKLVIAGAPGAGDTVTITVTGSGKFVKYTLISGDTAATVVTALLTLWSASPEREVTEITAAADPTSTTAILFTGPSNGATFTITTTKTGGVTVTDSNVTTETGPHHLDNVTNYSTGALPNAGGVDTLIFLEGSRGPMFALTALAAIDLVEVQRFAEFTGRWGLPEVNDNGYREYRTQFAQFNTAAIRFEASTQDQSQQFRVQSMSGSAVTVRVQGSDTPRSNDTPVFEFYATPAASILTGSNASVGVALQRGQTGTVVATLTNCFFECGTGATLTTPIFNNCTGTVRATATTLTITGESSEITFRNAAAVTGATLVQEGKLIWLSTGNLSSGTSCTVGTAGTVDLFNAPSALAAFNVFLNSGATLDDRNGKMVATSTVKAVGCSMNEVNWLTKSDFTVTL